jgi:hypothetical protein
VILSVKRQRFHVFELFSIAVDHAIAIARDRWRFLRLRTLRSRSADCSALESYQET